MDHCYKVEDIVGKTISLKIEGNSLIASWIWAETEDALLAKSLYDG